MNLDRIYCVEEIAEAAAVSRETVRRAIRSRRLVADRIGRRAFYVKTEDLAAWNPRLLMGPRRKQTKQLTLL
jgi:excisionase family DNA binding protein